LCVLLNWKFTQAILSKDLFPIVAMIETEESIGVDAGMGYRCAASQSVADDPSARLWFHWAAS
jgi:hypothetical protein